MSKTLKGLRGDSSPILPILCEWRQFTSYGGSFTQNVLCGDSRLFYEDILPILWGRQFTQVMGSFLCIITQCVGTLYTRPQCDLHTSPVRICRNIHTDPIKLHCEDSQTLDVGASWESNELRILQVLGLIPLSWVKFHVWTPFNQFF